MVIKCPKCGNISKPSAILCIECGTSLRTGKAHVPAPQIKQKSNKLALPKMNIVIWAIIAVSVVILLFTALFIPKIWSYPQRIISKFFKDSEEGAEKIEEIS